MCVPPFFMLLWEICYSTDVFIREMSDAVRTKRREKY